MAKKCHGEGNSIPLVIAECLLEFLLTPRDSQEMIDISASPTFQAQVNNILST